MADTTATYVATAGQREFEVTFDFLDVSHVGVTVRGTPVSFAWVSPTLVRLTQATGAGDAVRIARTTPIANALVQFQAGATLTEADLNTAIRQTLFIQQEITELYHSTLDAARVRLGDNLGVVGTPSDIMDQLVQLALASELLDTLQSRITDINLNAEAILDQAFATTALTVDVVAVENRVGATESGITAANTAATALNGRVTSLTAVVDALAAIDTEGLGTIIETERQSRIDGDSATASVIALIGAANGPRTAFDLNLTTARVTPSETLGQRLSALSASDGEARALITAEQTARVTAVGSVASDLSAVAARVGTSEAQIITDRTSRVSGDNANATLITALTARVGTAESTIISDRSARVSGDSVLTTALDLLTARTGTAEATIVTDRSARVSGDSALGLRVDAVLVTTGANTAAITAETGARTTAIAAEAALRTTLAARVGTAEGAIITETNARVAADSSEAASRTALATRVGTAEGAILTEATSRSDADGAILGTIALLGARNTGGTAFVLDMATAQVGGGVSLGTRFSGIDTRVGAAEASVAAETSARTTAIAAEASSRTALATRMTSAEAGIAAESTARATAIDAEAALRTALATRVGTAESAIVSETTARTTAIAAEATSRGILATTVGGHTASISTQQTSINGLSARAGVTIDVNGHVTGWSLNNDGASGSFTILANRFTIIDPGAPGAVPYVPFEIVGGVTRIRNALIDNLDLTRLGSGTFNGVMDVGTGRMVFNNGTTMMVHGVGFGTSNQFLEWSGPTMAVNLCSESNGVRWFKTNGDAYFGGALSIGTLTSKVSTSSLAVSPEVETAVFGSNGDQILVNLSYNRTISGRSATAPATGPITATVTMYRSIGGGAYAGVVTLTATGTQTAEYDSEFGNYLVIANLSGSGTYSDPSLSTSNRQFKAVVSSRGGVTSLNSGVTGTQNLSIIATEQ